jgi:prevent-host-death family protein
MAHKENNMDKMKDTITVADARKHFSELMAQVAYTHKKVIVERRGKPMMALVNVEYLQGLETLAQDKEELRQQQFALLARAAALRKKMQQTGIYLTDSAELLNELREERIHEFSGLR